MTDIGRVTLRLGKFATAFGSGVAGTATRAASMWRWDVDTRCMWK